MTNINSYGAGRVLFSSEDLERVRPNDGLLEVFTVADPLALGLLNNPFGARSTPFQQARRVEMTLGGGQFFQLDGEPFFVDAECRVTVEHHRKVRLLCPPERRGQNAVGGVWRGRQRRAFWREAIPPVTPGVTPQPNPPIPPRPRRLEGAKWSGARRGPPESGERGTRRGAADRGRSPRASGAGSSRGGRGAGGRAAGRRSAPLAQQPAGPRAGERRVE